MSGSVNRVCLLGNVGKDPEIRQSGDGRKIANLTIATSESFKDKDGKKQERTEWHKVVVFNEGLANIVDHYVHKGSKLYIEGTLKTRKWTDTNGIEKYTTEIVLGAYNGVIVLLDSSSNKASSDNDGWDNSPKASAALADEIPF